MYIKKADLEILKRYSNFAHFIYERHGENYINGEMLDEFDLLVLRLLKQQKENNKNIYKYIKAKREQNKMYARSKNEIENHEKAVKKRKEKENVRK